MGDEAIVTIYVLEKRPDGTVGIGNSLEVPVSEAILMIRNEQAMACGCSRGVIPDEFSMLAGQSKKKSKGLADDEM